MNYFTAALGAVVGGLIVTQFGFETLFIIMTVISWSSAIYIFHLKRIIL